MKNIYTTKVAISALLACFALVSFNASAGQDEMQRQLIQQSYKLQLQAKAKEAALQSAAMMNQAACMKAMKQSNSISGS